MVPSTRSTDRQVTTSANKGRSLGRTGSQDVEENDPAYFQLSHPVHENLRTTNVEYRGTRGSFVHEFVRELLQKGDSAQKFMQGSRSIKIDNWMLLDNYVHGRGSSTGYRMRALQSHSKRSKGHMSLKQHKKYGSFDLPQHLQKKNQLAQCLLNADLHGAYILVVPKKACVFICLVDCLKITLLGDKLTSRKLGF
ncbi:uncharacterized protein LOC120013825 isoform X3 [Tripterygium wilfordii]|uniref:uncharacterized protein LOC120013825 isoform X3 n=1 Tax=Tripterygium wilfordii TaxID=458696 RepID=UPI0018F86469|nr:uncharacterized protein LOC120013825 isoform X3 [Tripterygium wilfordii]